MTLSSNPPVDAARLQTALVRWFSGLTHQGMFATDCSMRILVWNRWMEVHSGRPASDVVGQPLYDVYTDLTIRGLDQHYEDALTGRISMISFGLHKYLLPLVPTNAELGLAEMPQSGRIGPLMDGDAIIGTVTTIEDISDRLASESELRKQIDVQRMARVTAEKAIRAKDEFLSTVSHEMRNPLNAVLGWARILIERSDVDPAVLSRAVRAIERNASALARIIDDLLDVARISSGKLRLEMHPVDLSAIALAALDVIGPSIKAKQLELRTRLDPKTPPVLGDQQRLQQVIWNLLSNAVKFTDPSGVIELTVTRAGAGARIVVRDTGQGISQDFLPYVFERFRQSDASSSRRHGGLGLGLALVKEVVELHGGCVTARSDGEGSGATFTIDLPTVMSDDVRHPQAEVDQPGSELADSLAGVRVLVIDDESDSRELLSEFLSKCGALVSSVASSDEALSHIRMSPLPRRPHVILSDLGMPTKDGYEFMRELRALRTDDGGGIPAVAVSGYANPDDRQRALAAGYQTHVAKPIDLAALSAALVRAAQGV
ncbi:MAG TPA: ATP-binding protein [Vicinamibacterales bacterium]|jgi:signal transduction histidine kinase/ActR/RegA family two-component response regulator